MIDKEDEKGTRGLVYYITAISQHCKIRDVHSFLPACENLGPLPTWPNKQFITIIIIIVIIYKHK